MSANSQLTTAVHALCWIELAARQGETPLTSERVAESLASHPVLVRRVLSYLKNAGIVSSGRGPGSGWRLERPAANLSLREVHEALNQGSAFALHPHEPKAECPIGGGIRPVLREIYLDVDAAIAVELERHTIADLVERILHGRRPAEAT
jgi:Rrf2 family protein